MVVNIMIKIKQLSIIHFCTDPWTYHVLLIYRCVSTALGAGECALVAIRARTTDGGLVLYEGVSLGGLCLRKRLYYYGLRNIKGESIGSLC